MLEKFGKVILSKFGFNSFEDAEIAVRGLDVMEDYFKTYSLSRIFPYESYSTTHGLYINRNTVGFVFEGNPIIGCDSTIHSQLAGLFQYVLPEGSSIQFLLMADPYVGQILDDWVHPRHKIQNLMHSDLEWNPYQPIYEQIPTGSHCVSVRRDGLYINQGEHVFRFYGVKKFDQQWNQSLMSNLIGDVFQDNLQMNCPFFLHYGVYVPSQEKLKVRFMSRAAHVDRQVTSELAKYVPTAHKEAAENQFVRNQLANNHRFVQTNFTVGILSDPENLPQDDQAIKNLFRANKWELEETQYLHMQSLTSIMPMAWGSDAVNDLQIKNKIKKTLSSESANLLPIQGEWIGNGVPDMIFVGRRGQLFPWSPFANKTSNYNVSIVGQSGAGKSAFMQELVTGVLARGARAFVIDIGRSFKNTCQFLGGDFIEFKSNGSICLNPFTNINLNYIDEVNDSIKFIKGILSTMVRTDDSVDEGFIEIALQSAWAEKKTDTTITDVVKKLRTSSEQRARDLGTALYTYTNDGLNGRIFEGKANISFKNQLTVIELEELKNDPHLQNVILQMLSLIITNQVYCGDRTTPFIIMFDEAWQIMSGKQGATFIADLARRLRKYRSALVTGTQNLTDFYSSDAANAAYQNSAWKCILSQESKVIHDATSEKLNAGKVSLNISDFQKEMMLSLQTIQGQYSEIMIEGPHGYAVGRLLLDPFTRTLYSTQADEFAKVNKYLSQGKTIIEAIELVAREKFGDEMKLMDLAAVKVKKEASHGFEKAA
jgi:conjugal transfer ATP-binding protein TraC